jgi:hypothetical protein
MVFVNMSPAAASDRLPRGDDAARRLTSWTRRTSSSSTERTYAQHQNCSRGSSKSSAGRASASRWTTWLELPNLSSLAEIKPEFEFDHLFTKDIQRNRIKQDLLGAILSFAERMGTQVIAEGIETEELSALRRLEYLWAGHFLAGRPRSTKSY